MDVLRAIAPDPVRETAGVREKGHGKRLHFMSFVTGFFEELAARSRLRDFSGVDIAARQLERVGLHNWPELTYDDELVLRCRSEHGHIVREGEAVIRIPLSGDAFGEHFKPWGREDDFFFQYH